MFNKLWWGKNVLRIEFPRILQQLKSLDDRLATFSKAKDGKH